ncbi:hypothetical protein P154DRAFT_521760 [Amniculicola lignicola CBS 123094]|uniref:Uncharacterized protein n=1 Tax=Amniculicola lignicola CBS 123094 TaxID=1392246 RepID=A0A6A5WKB6_9PLEO|nr:hypothetical protein P154DRAFT_521760 [Amniculicola lignicola CBS 123094]
MKFAAVTLLFAALAIASPAPIAEPEAKPITIESRDALFEALEARAAAPAAEFEARAAGLMLESRDPKKSKPKTSSSGNTTDEGAAGMLTPSLALELAALGLGMVGLWA